MNSTNTSVRHGTAACSGRDTLERRLACLADAGTAAVDERLAELDHEWTAGRVTKAAIGTVSLVGLGLGAFVSPWWFALPAAGGLVLAQYLFTGRSGVSGLAVAAGFRPHCEIDHERTALRVLRGDFRHLPTVHDIEDQHDIARFEGEGGMVIEPEVPKVNATEAAREALTASVG